MEIKKIISKIFPIEESPPANAKYRATWHSRKQGDTVVPKATSKGHRATETVTCQPKKEYKHRKKKKNVTLVLGKIGGSETGFTSLSKTITTKK